MLANSWNKISLIFKIVFILFKIMLILYQVPKYDLFFYDKLGKFYSGTVATCNLTLSSHSIFILKF